MPFRRVVYVSRLVRPDPAMPDEQIVAEIVASGQRNNPRNGLTGALLHGEGRFAQVLEGPPGAVETTLRRIARDPRHAEMRLIEIVSMRERLFGQWSMACLGDLDAIPADFVEGNGTLELLMRLRGLIRSGAEAA